MWVRYVGIYVIYGIDNLFSVFPLPHTLFGLWHDHDNDTTLLNHETGHEHLGTILDILGPKNEIVNDSEENLVCLRIHVYISVYFDYLFVIMTLWNQISMWYNLTIRHLVFSVENHQ